MKHTYLHQVNWSWDVMMKGSLNNWRLLIAVMMGVLLSCSVLAGTVVFYSALEELALQKAIEDLPHCLLYTSPSQRDRQKTHMPSSAWKK